MSIKKSLKSYILLLSIVPVIVVVIITYIVVSNKYLDLNKVSLQNTADNYKTGYYAQLSSQLIELEALANLNDMKSYLLDKVNNSDINLKQASSYYESVDSNLYDKSSNYNFSVKYYLYDIDGYLVASSDRTSSSDWFEYMDTSIESYTSTSFLDDSLFDKDSTTLDIVTPVTVKGNTIGLLRSNISSSVFGAFVSDDYGTYILNSSGHFLFGNDKLAEHDPAVVDTSLDILNNYTESSPVSGTITDTGSSTYLMYGYSIIPETNWIYIVAQDGNDYKNIISGLPIILLIVLIILLIISLKISSSLSKKYTDPIYTLSDKMKEASTGQLDVHCNIDTEDEFGELSIMFNNMMDIISTNYNEIVTTKQALEDSQDALATNYTKIETLAYHDGLTGLYNRVAFMKYTHDILHNSSNLQRHAILFVDLDNFKNINDTLGHDYGDLLLKQISDKLGSYVTSDDILARTGGDEFLIFKNRITNIEELNSFAKELVSIATHSFLLEDERVHISMSIGVSIFPQNGLSINELIKNADIAMYSAKTSGKNNYMFFNSTMEDEVNRRNDLIDILRAALDNDEVYLVYQPQANASTGKITGFEALMRLKSSLVGLVSPNEFIPVAEECGLIDELGEWALNKACAFNKKLMDMGFDPIIASVNLSTPQLRSASLAATIANIPKRTGMSLDYLEVELTESVLMKNFEHNLSIINEIRSLGAKIALDDFGTGYSSFNYLTTIPINTLKIDKSFVAGLCYSEKDRFISSTIITLAHQLEISVIAEGVEEIEQLRILQQQGCDRLQGYFFSRPLSEDDFIQFLRNNI